MATHSRTYYRTRTAARALFWLGILIGAYYLVNHIWWTGNGWSWQTAPSL